MWLCNEILFDFRKTHSKQHVLFELLQSWQKTLHEKVIVATVLMDLSKAYYCIPHDLLIAEMGAYGIDSFGLLLVSDYLAHRTQTTKISSSYSSWYDIIRDVPQGSLLGLLLFNILINGLFFFIKKSAVCNVVDDNIPNSVGKNIENVISDLKTDLIGVMKWFKINSLKANPDKVQFLVPGIIEEKYFNVHINKVETKTK